MIKLALTLTIVTLVAVGSALAAGPCGGCSGEDDKEKTKDAPKEGTKESYSLRVVL